MVVKRAAIIITDADELGYQELRRNAFGERASAPRRVMPSGQLLADLVWLLGTADRTIERAGNAGEDTAALLLGGVVTRVRAALAGEGDEDE
jgi:hypothetical protein